MSMEPDATTTRPRKSRVSKSGPMPSVDVENAASSNGHNPIPPGNAEVFLTDDNNRGGINSPDFLQFITAHPEDKARLLAEARLTPELEELYVDAMEDDQAEWGYVSTNSITTARIVVTIGRDGQARDEAVRVATSQQSLMGKTQGWMQRMFGARGGPPSPPTGASVGEPGY